MKEKKFNQIAFWLISTVNALLCLVSFWTSKLGLETTTDSWLVATSVAFAGGAFAFVFWFFLSRKFGEALTTQKVAYCFITIIVGFLLFGFSTQWSVITLGGREAVSIHMQTVLSQSDLQGIELLKKGSQEANLAPQLESLASQFDSYAERESRGAFSHLPGEGDVVATLKNTAETFRSLAKSVKETERSRKRFYDDLQFYISEAREILSRSDKNLRKTNLLFSQKLSEINENLTRMAKTTSYQFLINVNRNLSALTVVTSEKTKTEQLVAIDRLSKTISAAQKIVSKMARDDQFDEMKIQTFTMISMSSAVLRYAAQIFYAWAYAIALDFAPFLFVLLLALSQRGKIDDEIIKNLNSVTVDLVDEISSAAKKEIEAIRAEKHMNYKI